VHPVVYLLGVGRCTLLYIPPGYGAPCCMYTTRVWCTLLYVHHPGMGEEYTLCIYHLGMMGGVHPGIYASLYTSVGVYLPVHSLPVHPVDHAMHRVDVR